MEEGLIEEVEALHAHKSENGAEWSRLEALGLEYRFVSDYLQGKISFDRAKENFEKEIKVRYPEIESVKWPE